MSDDVLEKIRRLVALSASSNENEARNSAFLACKLMREYHVELRLGVEKPVQPARPPGNPGAVRGNPVKKRRPSATHFGAQPGFDTFEDDPRPNWHVPYQGRIVRARALGTCKKCGIAWRPGARLVPWEGGFIHLLCSEQVQAAIHRERQKGT